jgi:hypothetical protein
MRRTKPLARPKSSGFDLSTLPLVWALADWAIAALPTIVFHFV